jgi:choice-of-anchor B domain-containing protein
MPNRDRREGLLSNSDPSRPSGATEFLRKPTRGSLRWLLALTVPWILLAPLAPAPARAAVPLTYTEPPDLSASNPNLGSVAVGANSISGTITVDCTSVCGDDPDDSFEFSVPAGLQVTHVELIISNYSSATSTEGVVTGGGGGISTEVFVGNTTYSNLIISPPLTAGLHDLQVFGFQEDFSGEDVSFSWVFNLTVTAVPTATPTASPTPTPTAIPTATPTPTPTAATITLVGQLDPVAGVDIYADVWGEGDYAYVGVYNGVGVFIIDVSDPVNPSLVSTYIPTTGTGLFKDVKVYDGVGYFADDDGDGVHVVDVSTPATPTLLAKITSVESGFDHVHNLSKSGSYLYLAGYTDTVKVFNVSSPASPVYVRDIVTPDSAIHDVTALGTRLYVSGIGSGFHYIYDTSTIGASAPPLLGTVPSGDWSHSSWASSDGTILVTAQEDDDGKVQIFDISIPDEPDLLSTMDRTFLGIDAISPHNPVLFNDTLLFVSWYEAGVVVIDISDPLNPLKVGHYDTYLTGPHNYNGNWGVYPFLGLDRVLLSDLQGGLYVMDATGLPEPGLGLQLAVGVAFLVGVGRRRARR